MNTDYYEFANHLKRLAEDLHSNAVGVTISDVIATLSDTSRMITHLADEVNHYRLRSSMVVVINGEEVELPEDLVDYFYKEVATSWVTNALRSFLYAYNSQVPNAV